uniref:Lpa1 n=1 Tax=Arundo donax TaxID=35708 RepID=A0A0A9CN36_ARUDO
MLLLTLFRLLFFLYSPCIRWLTIFAHLVFQVINIANTWCQPFGRNRRKCISIRIFENFHRLNSFLMSGDQSIEISSSLQKIIILSSLGDMTILENQYQVSSW